MPAVPNVMIYPTSVRGVQAVATAAKSSLTDTASAVKLCTIGASGGLLKKLRARPRATVTATRLDLFVTKAADTTDASPMLIDSRTMAPSSLSATAQITATDFDYTTSDPRRLEAGDKLWVSIAVALAAGIVFEGEIEEFGS